LDIARESCSRTGGAQSVVSTSLSPALESIGLEGG